jgi:hypothetical protein
MSGGGDTAPVEEEYHHEEKHEQKVMDSKQTEPKFTTTHVNKGFDDNRSVGSGKSDQPLLSGIVCENTADKVTVFDRSSVSEDYLERTTYSRIQQGRQRSRRVEFQSSGAGGPSRVTRSA